MAEMIHIATCPYCGSQNRDGRTRCGDCGKALIVLRLRGIPEPFILAPSARTVLGRTPTPGPDEPHLDLTHYGGDEKGVSRQHAAIDGSETVDLTLEDLSSSNGTFLNGERLVAHKRYGLSSGDEIRLGNLFAKITFEQDQHTGNTDTLTVTLWNEHNASNYALDKHSWQNALWLAAHCGWQPLRDYLVAGQEMTGETALEFAKALEEALPEVAADAPEIDQTLGRPRNPFLAPLEYFGGEAGKQTLREVIAFCREGAFVIGH